MQIFIRTSKIYTPEEAQKIATRHHATFIEQVDEYVLLDLLKEAAEEDLSSLIAEFQEE